MMRTATNERFSEAHLPPDFQEALSKPRRGLGDGSQVDLASGALAISTTSPDGYEFFDSVSLDEATEIYRWVRELKPAAAIEIGMCSAASTLSIVQAMEDNGHGQHYVCDPYQNSALKNIGLKNIERSGLGDRVHFAPQFPEQAISGWPTAGFAFIDASHLFDLTMLDFVLVDKRLEVGGIVGLHDLWMSSLQKVVRYAITNRGYEVVGPKSPPGRRQRAKAALGAFLARTRQARRLLAPEILLPWSTIHPSCGALLFLRKTRNDDRNWRDHVTF